MSTMLFLSALPCASAIGGTKQATDLDFDAARESLAQFFNQIDSLRSSLDRGQVELDAVLNSTNFDAVKLVKYVGEQVYFEQYEGVLRGARGTLRSRAGNALDQSLLLATLLKDAGFDARIVRGQLRPSDAEALIASMSTPRIKLNPYSDKAKYDTALRELWKLTGTTEDDFEQFKMRRAGPDNSADHFEAVDAETEFILSKLQEHQVSHGGTTPAASSLANEALDYYWVEYADGVSDWQSAHPAFGHVPSGPPETPEVSQTFSAAIARELQHRFRMEVIVEQRQGGKVDARTVFGPWERPVSELGDSALTFASIPLSLAGSMQQGSLDVPLGGNDIFVPSFSGGEDSKAFDLLGNVIPMDAAQSQFAAVFATDAEKLGNAASALSGLGASDDEKSIAAELAAVKLKFTFVLPSGAENSYWRSVYDSSWVPAGAPESKRRAVIYQSLTQNQSFLIVNGTPTEAARLDAAFAVLASKKAALYAVLHRAFGREVDRSTSYALSWAGLVPTFELFDAYETRSSLGTYRHQPSMLRYRATLPSLGPGFAAVDIVQNKRRITSPHHEGSAESIRALISHGAWESLVEGEFLPSQAAKPTNTVSAFKAFRQSGTDFEVLALGRQNTLINQFPEKSRSALEQDLARGYALIVPNPSSIPPGMKLHWWRVDPLTGETLGIGSTGEGEALVFHTIQQRLIAGTVIGGAAFTGCILIGGVVNAEVQPGTVTGGDCVAFGIATGIGAGLGASVGEGLAAGIGVGIATYAIGKLVDAWGVLE